MMSTQVAGFHSQAAGADRFVRHPAQRRFGSFKQRRAIANNFKPNKSAQA
jgi:hypothetical protein